MFKFNGVNNKITMAISLANDYELLNYVYSRILESPQYDMSTAPSTYIAKKYYDFMRIADIEVKIYYPRWRYSKALGYFSSSNPRVININGYKISSMDEEELVSLFYHESGHSWDHSDEKYQVNHGSNNPSGKENTFQYSLNKYVYEFYNYERKAKYKHSFLSRVINFLVFWK
jgi:hypothetical protein